MSKFINVTGFGRVSIKELTVKEAEPFLAGSLKDQEVVKFLLGACIVVDGKPLGAGVEDITLKQYKALSKLVATILEVNGMGKEEKDEEGEVIPNE